MRRISIIASASGNGKTTLGKALSARTGIPFVELDALHHGPGWIEASADELRAKVEPIVHGDAWIIDGRYYGKLGGLVRDRAELVVWLDLPMRVWLPRLIARSARRMIRGEELWNGNRETVRGLIGSRTALFPYAFTSHFASRCDYPKDLAAVPHVRLRTREEVRLLVVCASREEGVVVTAARG